MTIPRDEGARGLFAAALLSRPPCFGYAPASGRAPSLACDLRADRRVDELANLGHAVAEVALADAEHLPRGAEGIYELLQAQPDIGFAVR
jgi:hypothetical protein